MLKFELVLTTRCNMNCDYCYTRRLHKRDMPLELIHKALDTFPITDLIFTGGEPLLRFDLIKSVLKRINSKRNMRIFINTNGSLLNYEITKFIKKYDVNIELSLDGSREIHDKHRRLKNNSGTFDIIAKNIKILKTHKIDLNINCVVTPDSIKGLAERLLYLIKEFKSNVFLGYVFNRQPITNLESRLFTQEVIGFCHIYWKENLFLNNIEINPFDNFFFKLLYGYKGGFTELMSTKCKFDKLCLFPDGKIYLCPACLVIPSSYRKKITIGNLYAGSLSQDRLLFFNEKFTLYNWLKNSALRQTNNICYLRSKNSVKRFFLDAQMKKSILFVFYDYLNSMSSVELNDLKDSCLRKKAILYGDYF